MNPISTSVSAINIAFARFDSASANLIDSVSGASSADPAVALAEQSEAKVQVEANIGVVRIADEMFKALLEISREG